MIDILNTINHTTVEALGFKYEGRKLIATEYADEFSRDDMFVRLYDNGASIGIKNGVQIPLTLKALKMKKAA